MHTARVCAVLVGSAAVPATSARAAVPPADATRDSERLVQLAGNGVSVGGSASCHYTTTEIIAIILGFLLFIIPGIILLIVFC
jgi:hypothetical protein